MSGSSQQQNTFKESVDICETKRNERRSISPLSSAYNGLDITIDDTPPGSPIRENSQTVEVANRVHFSCRSPNPCRYHIRSPPPPHNPSPLLYIMNRSSSPYDVSYDCISHRKQSRSRSPISRRRSRSPYPSQYRSRSPSIRYLWPGDAPRYGYTRRLLLTEPFDPHFSPSPEHRSCSTSPLRHIRVPFPINPSLSPSPLRRGCSASRRGRSPSPLRGRSSTPRFRNRLPSSLCRGRSRSPRGRSRSPLRRSRSRSIQERKLRLSEKQDEDRIILVSDSPPKMPVSSQEPRIPVPLAESSISSPRVTLCSPEPVTPTPQPGPNRSSSATRHSAYNHFTPNFASVIETIDALPIKVMENLKHINNALSASQNANYFKADEVRQTGMTDYTLIETDNDHNVVGKDMPDMKENIPEAVVKVPTSVATESFTNQAVADQILPVRLYTQKLMVGMFSYLDHHTNSKNKGYRIQPSPKNKDINSNSSNSSKVPIAPASVRLVEKHSASDDLGGIRKKVARLLPPWKVKMSDDGDIYYYNPITDKTSQTRPA
ncbi:hypothetical protein INT47_002488 [Mucor saturninus]|uniref:WW domain-containing protein n=1 Tax=Mucor saturninus TaxID=64648 RepID=A0A8H7V561_9FUNG|nr:hypothetical protein INT47_002488 [Mucor saturninus]